MGQPILGQSVEHLGCAVHEAVLAYLREHFLEVLGVVGLFYRGLLAKRVVRRR